MRISILTSSRADYGIYKPLLQKLYDDDFFDCRIIAFGTHLSAAHGMTLKNIVDDGYQPYASLETFPSGDEPGDISRSMGKTIAAFSEFWSDPANESDIVFCLGDRYEMFAAVISGVPFNIKFAHIHGGEETEGAIDNVFRHSITLASSYHFVSMKGYADRVTDLTGSREHIYYSGALSIDNLASVKLLSAEQFYKKFHIDLDKPSVLVTYHPETAAYAKNASNIAEVIKALEYLAQHYQLVITMPNADTMGNLIRSHLNNLAQQNPTIYTIENLGTEGYFSCMNLVEFLAGNTSSGIIEAASFGKYVINIGSRQKGRESGPNVLHCSNDAAEIISCAERIKTMPVLRRENIYGDGKAAERIIETLKKL